MSDTVYRISAHSDMAKLERKIRRALRRGPVRVAGEFSCLKLLYLDLVGRLSQLERASLSRLEVPMAGRNPEVQGMPDRRAERRVGRDRAGAFPLEHLLLLCDLPSPEKFLNELFPRRQQLPSGARVRFNDPKGFLSLGQIRAILDVLSRLEPNSAEAALVYTVERWPDHMTFHPPVLVELRAGRAVVDVAQLEGRGDFRTTFAQELRRSIRKNGTVAIDPEFVRYDQTCAWAFNRAFWRFLGIWERETGKSYQRALPKGKAESNHREFIEEAADHFAAHVRESEREGGIEPHSELWIHEKAPGSGEFVAGLLDQLRTRHPHFYRRVRVVLSDISKEVLDIAAGELRRRGHLDNAQDGPHIFFRNLSESEEPEIQGADGSVVPLAGRFLYARHANFFDQLPARLFAKQGSRFYEVYVRAVVCSDSLAALEKEFGCTLRGLKAVIDGGFDLERVGDAEQARWIGFWSQLWAQIKFEERLEPVENLAARHPYGLDLARLFADLDEVRFVTSDGAMEALYADLRLLHPAHGYACFSDIYLQRPEEFQERWIELAKYDNGVWVGTNGILLGRVLSAGGYEFSFYPVELTLDLPTPVYTLNVKRQDPIELGWSPRWTQLLAGIEGATLPATSVAGLPQRVRNNLRELPDQLHRIDLRRDWASRAFDPSFDLTTLLRELYYHSPPRLEGERSLFVKFSAVVAEALAQHRDARVCFDIDLPRDGLEDLKHFLESRPIPDLARELVEAGPFEDGALRLRVRLPTLSRKIQERGLVLLAEIDLPRSQSVEQLRRRILQVQKHVDAVSLTSGRLAESRFLRSRELLGMPLLESVDREKLVVTLEMRDRRAADLENDIRSFEARGVSNFFILTGDFDRYSQWWLDSLHGMQIADRLRSGEGVDGRELRRPSRALIVGAMTWGGIPDLKDRLERDVILKARSGADMLFSQPVYDLPLARSFLDLVSDARLDREIRLVVEVLPVTTLELLGNLAQAPGILVPKEMILAYGTISRNVEAFMNDIHGGSELEPANRGRFSRLIFDGVREIPGYRGFFSAPLAEELFEKAKQAYAQAYAKAPKGREAEKALEGLRSRVIAELGLALAERAMAELAGHPCVSGFLFVARTGQELRRLTARAKNFPLEARAQERQKRTPGSYRLGRQGPYGQQLSRLAERLARFGLGLSEGTPLDRRRPALIRGGTEGGPMVLVRLDLPRETETGGFLPPSVDVLVEALSACRRQEDLDLRVLCVPEGWEENSHLIQKACGEADYRLHVSLHAADLKPSEARRRGLRLRFSGEPWKVRVARWLEGHPLFYGLAVLTEFSWKHPLFGQVLCGGPCGISGAWQFSCTMGKTFVSKRQIQDNLLERPVFETARRKVEGRPLRRALWGAWEKFLCGALWPAILLRRGVVWLARRIPVSWFTRGQGTLRTLITTFINHLECPKSLRNGACGAPTREGLCGELLKYNVSKACIFVTRNVKDRCGMRLAERFSARAAAWRDSPWPCAGRFLANVLQIAAAFVNRKPLSNRIYPRVDTTVAGASAILNAVMGRFRGATVFGDPSVLPPLIPRSEIRLVQRRGISRKLLREIRGQLRGMPRCAASAGTIVAGMLDGIAATAAADREGEAESVAAASTYERMLIRRFQASERESKRKLHS